MSDRVAAAKREVLRCRRAVAAGSPVAFWEKRLRAAMHDHFKATAVLVEEIERLSKRERTGSVPGGGGAG